MRKLILMKRLYLFVFGFIGAVSLSFGQSVGPFGPSIYATSGSGAGWSNLEGVSAVDNNPAYADLAQYPTCNSFICYHSDLASFAGFGFIIPNGVSITGIQIDAMQRVSSPGGGIHDSSLVLSLNGLALGSDHADPDNWLDTPTMNVYGDSTDTWDYSWTPIEINDPNFGLLYRVTNDSYDQPASLDFLSMTVYYQTGTGINSQSSSPWNIGFINTKLLISGQSSILSSGARVEVRSLEGKLEYSNELEPGSGNIDLSIDCSSWSAGVFLVNVISSNVIKIQRKVLLNM